MTNKESKLGGGGGGGGGGTFIQAHLRSIKKV